MPRSPIDQRQKSLNRCGDSSVYRTVCWMFLCPSQACSARVSWPASSALANQSSRSQARAEAASIESAPPGLPPNMSYYRGAQPDDFRSGSPWPDANFEIVRKTAEIFPGFFVLTTVSEKPGTRDMNELSLAIKTPEGLAVV